MRLDWIHFHLMVNHFPVILGVIGAAAALLAAVRKSDAIWSYAAVTLILAGLFAPASFLSGRQAEDEAEQLPAVSEEVIHDHEERAELAIWSSVATAALAVVSLRRPHPLWRLAMCGLALLAGVAMGAAALEGGEIVHGTPVPQVAVAIAGLP